MAEDPTGPSVSDDDAVQHTRAWTGLWVVIGGDTAIAVAAIVAVLLIGHHSVTAAVGAKGATGIDTTSIVAILASAFTAISTMTSAYFGIRAASNTAQTSMQNSSSDTSQPGARPPQSA